MGRYSPRKPHQCPQPSASITSPLLSANLFFHSLLMNHWRSPRRANILHSDRIYCPYPNCSVLLDPLECLSARASSSSQSDNSCIDCPVCQNSSVDCGVPWHSSMSCEEFQTSHWKREMLQTLPYIA
ncbi:putative E3 ubiquitin-protein ligase ARI11 [Prunus yedoensis var. nudiflora]|uniref:Putative E3 ubiquitin-protein ligase ARI11 n=1 Tax=Prunus yedoensis var. nudiflora TaxID=2094558 RepID=A0A314XW35_PRUYE|nr:putative E3 ubiquitin-protein ligase ARI11 [Prunus yedoensis var. nudiflora]